jgi:hypothetical protein
MTSAYEGLCHCGALAFRYATRLPPRSWSVRACQCSFCRAHGASCTSDPEGSVVFRITKPEALVRYRFALRTADFLVCRSCGVYLAAVLSDGGRSFATINVNAIAPVPFGLPRVEPFSYDSESVEERIARRVKRWTPVTGGI